MDTNILKLNPWIGKIFKVFMGKVLYVPLLLTFFIRYQFLTFLFSVLLLLLITNSSIITLINVFVIKKLKLPLLLPLLLLFLFFLLLLILLHLFVIVSFSQCCYSYQVRIAIIVSFVSFLIYTFACASEFQPLEFSFN